MLGIVVKAVSTHNVTQIHRKMTELSSLLSRRGLLKGQLTRFNNFVQSTQVGGDINIIQLKLRMEKIKEVWQDFETVQTSIEDSGVNEETAKYRTDFENLYFESVAVCESLNIKDTENSVNNDGSNKKFENGKMNALSEASSVSTGTPNFTSMVKLAPQEIPNFTGINSEWAAFHDIFSVLVHRNSTLSNIQKFFYLRSSVTGDAAKSIQFLDTSSDNYQVAWDALISRYSNKKTSCATSHKEVI